jgi:glucose 1-dehydrogenase
MNQVRNYSNKERVAVVTGSSKGIGKAIAMEFAKARYSIVINARKEEELKQAAEDISKSSVGGKVVSIAGDISQEHVCISLIEGAVKHFGRIDVLVNNAGIGGESKKIHELTEKDWDEVIDVNLKGTFLCTREAIKNMTKNGGDSQGRINNNYSIINISSVHEQTPHRQSAQYAASKGGMEMLTKTVALELADKGIRVNGIAPGAIATDMNKELLENKEEKEKKERQIPVHRIGKPEEIAKVALFLASDDASYVAGTTIYADGGLTLVS